MTADLACTTAVVLAGGLGTRLRSTLADTPKILAPIGGRPFLEILLGQLARQGVKDVVLCTGFQADKVSAFCGDGSRFGLTIRNSLETRPLGTGGALKLAERLVGSDPFLALNGDSFVDADLTALLAFHRDKKALATLLLTRVPDRARFGSVTVDSDGRIVRFDEKGHEGAGYINAGVYVFAKRALAGITTDRSVSVEDDVFPSFCGKGLYALAVEAPFIDIGTPESYARAASFLHGRA